MFLQPHHITSHRGRSCYLLNPSLLQDSTARIFAIHWHDDSLFWKMAPAHSKFAMTSEEETFAREDLPNRIVRNEEGPDFLNWNQQMVLIGQPSAFTLVKVYWRNLDSFLSESHWVRDARYLRVHLARAGVIVNDDSFHICLHKNGLQLLASLRFCDWRNATIGCLPFDALVAF